MMMIKNNNNSLMSFSEHFYELRKRIIFCLTIFFVSTIISYFFIEQIYNFLLQPFIKISQNLNRRIIYTSPSEAFITYLKLSFYSGIFFSLPIFITQIYFFLSPALYKNEKKNIIIFFFGAFFLFLFGAIFSYFFILPITLEFFSSFEIHDSSANDNFKILLETKISEYLSFVLNLIFGFGIAFQSPLLLIFLIKTGCLSINDLRKKRKYWIVIIFIVSAILTPPDLLSQVSLAILLILFFEIVILIGKNF
jgi:sec-independent protein translocase protein TatC